ncbi:MSCRAMM family adhesin SdrC, partial [Clostridioides difficile]|uniref:MSCRAMM family adhesin SdrC n=1 Tax=Clostridioides difficile TaxID=1496 RepID=UPI001E5F3D90|nr:MSCRAMM family adhesin SdrC [Clostridioides difficile]
PDPDNGGNSKPDPDNGGNSKPDPDNGGNSKPDIDTDGDGKPDINIDTDESLDSNVGQNIQTGDQSNIMLDLALMFISLFFLIKNLTNKYLRRK